MANKHTEMYSTFVAVGEIQMKIAVVCQLHSDIAKIIKIISRKLSVEDITRSEISQLYRKTNAA